jgi:hypothetical protein
LEKIGNWDVKLLERVFSYFAKKITNEKSFAKLLLHCYTQRYRTPFHVVPHRIFVNVVERDSGEIERDRCFMKQPPRELKCKYKITILPLYELLLPYNSQFYFYSMHKLRNYEFLRDNLENNHCTCCLLSCLKITGRYIRPFMRILFSTTSAAANE